MCTSHFLSSPKNATATLGFSLIELMTVLSVFIIASGIGTPALSKWLQRSAESTAFTSLHHLITFTRTQAIKENTYFTLCPSSDNQKCTGEWNKTLIIFSDANKNEQLDGGERLFKSIALPAVTPCLEWRSGASRQYVQFKPSGATNGTAGHFLFCDGAHSATKKKLVLSFGGRTSLKTL